MSGFGKCCDCRESHLLCDLLKVLTDKSHLCAVELVLLKYSVSKFVFGSILRQIIRLTDNPSKASVKVFLKILRSKAVSLSRVYVLSRPPGVCFSQR